VSGTGTVSPNRAQVADGQSQTFTLSPGTGFTLSSVVGCPGQLQGLRYVTTALRASCSLQVRFVSSSASVVDANLAAAIRSRLSLAEGAALDAPTLARLTDLNLSGKSVKDLSGLEAAVNMTKLVLSNNPLSQLAPLAALPRLADLDASRTAVADASALARLPLTRVNLSDTPVENLEFARSLAQLRYINIANTKVTDISPLVRSGLGNGAQAELGTSTTGCLYTAGYSRPLQDMASLRGRGVRVNFYDEIRRRGDCGNGLAAARVQTRAQLGSRDLTLTWTLEGANLPSAWRCELHPDLSLQQPAEPLLRMENCPASGSLSYAESSGVPARTLVIDDGLGGRLVQPLSLTRDAMAPAPSLYVERVDFGQAVVRTFPRLVANRDALMRVHLINTGSEPVPKAQVTLQLGDQRQTLSMTAPSSLPRSVQITSKDSSYSLVLPARWVQPGLSLSLQVGSITKTWTPVVGKATVLYLTLVPIQVGGASPQVFSNDAVARALKTYWPLADVQVRVREPVAMTFSNAGDVLNQVAQLRAADGDSSYYYGLLPANAPNFSPAGIAYVRNGVGVGDDASVDRSGQVMAHELGHMFSLYHTNCGGPAGPDLAYPYPNALIGSLGVNFSLTDLIQPTRIYDVMSYCGPKHASDFGFTRVQNYLEARPPKPFKSSASALKRADVPSSWYISGEHSADGQWRLQLTASPLPVETLPESEYSLVLINAQGERQSLPLYWQSIDHPEDGSGRYFRASAPPLDAVRAEIWRAGVRLHQQDLP
jgi:hypothetical protein